jgi:hypothetical protein
MISIFSLNHKALVICRGNDRYIDCVNFPEGVSDLRGSTFLCHTSEIYCDLHSSMLLSIPLDIKAINDGTLDPGVLQDASRLVGTLLIHQNADKVQRCINASS